MSASKPVRFSGLTAVYRQWRLGLAFYVMTTLAALPTAAAVGALMNGYFGYSQASTTMTSGGSMPLIAEVIIQETGAWGAILVTAAVTGFIWFLLQSFIASAVLGTVRSSKPPNLRTGLAHGGAHWWGLMLLSLLGTPFVLLVGGVGVAAAGWLTDALTGDSTSEAYVMAVRLPTHLLALVGLIWASGTHDAMRTYKVDGRGVFGAFGRGLWRGLTRPLALLGRSVPWWSATLVITAVVMWVDAQMVWSSTSAIATGIALQQGLVLLRVFLRIGGLAAVQGLIPPPEPAP